MTSYRSSAKCVIRANFATAQAELVKSHGQRYVDTVKQAIDVSAGAWEEIGNRVESPSHDVSRKAERAASSKRAA